MVRSWHVALACALGSTCLTAAARAQQAVAGVVAHADSVSVNLVDVDLRAAIQALSPYIDRPIVFGAISGVRATLQTPQPIAASEVARLLRGLLESQGFELFADSAAGLYRVRQKETPRSPADSPAPLATPGGALQLNVIHLRHARATDVAATVSALYGRGGALGEPGARPSTLSRDLQGIRAPVAPNVGMIDSGGVPGRRSATFSGEVVIVPDSRANSLLVRASQRDFDLVNAAVRELDIRPLQVLIAVTIAEVRKDRTFALGVSVDAPQRHAGRDPNQTIGGSVVGGTMSDLVIQVLNVGARDIDVTLRAAAARGDVSILSRPVVIAANNEEAEINVGSQRPFVQVSRVLPTDNAARDQVVQYQPVGTRLSVRPTISPDGYVMLQVTQEVNQATNESSGLSGVEAPVISTRSVQTQLLIKDRQTVILGGLSDRQRDVSRGGVPLLSSIPWLGALFGRTNRQFAETELYLFIMPQVIRDDGEAEAVTKPLQDKAERSKP